MYAPLHWLSGAGYVAGQVGNCRDEGNHLGNLGIAYADLGETARARELWHAALRLFAALESPHVETVRRWLAESGGED
jgi:hypothetical protein